MKKLTSISCSLMLVAAISATAFGKSGIIVTTKSGTIVTTKTGTIVTTRTGTIATNDTTSTGRTSALSTSTMNTNRFSLVELFWTVFGSW